MALRVRPALCVLLVLPVPCLDLQAQRVGSVTGTVRAADSGPLLEGARVTLVGTTYAVVTSAKGEFTFHGLIPGKYIIRASAIGFATLSSPIEVKAQETLEIEFEAEPEGVRLPELAVKEAPNLPAEFLRRSASGGGRYMSRADIERRNASTVGDLLRTFPGMRVDCRYYPCRVSLMRHRNCPMAYWLDGAPTEAGTVLLQPPRDLDGVEVYSGLAEMPPELFRPNTCGALVIWTRTPPRQIRKEKPPKPAPAKPDTAVTNVPSGVPLPSAP